MIISHKHKFIFIKTRKTAGTSIEILLSSVCGEDDVITANSPKEENLRGELGYKTEQNVQISPRYYTLKDFWKYLRTRKKPQFTNHCNAEFVKTHIPKKVWNSYYKFTFERNPYERYISLYYFRKGHPRKTKLIGDIDSFIERKLKNTPSMTSY